jgi:hypothetical protein
MIFEIDPSQMSEKERKRLERAKRFGIDPSKQMEEDDGSTYVSFLSMEN